MAKADKSRKVSTGTGEVAWKLCQRLKILVDNWIPLFFDFLFSPYSCLDIDVVQLLFWHRIADSFFGRHWENTRWCVRAASCLHGQDYNKSRCTNENVKPVKISNDLAIEGAQWKNPPLKNYSSREVGNKIDSLDVKVSSTLSKSQSPHCNRHSSWRVHAPSDSRLYCWGKLRICHEHPRLEHTMKSRKYECQFMASTCKMSSSHP